MDNKKDILEGIGVTFTPKSFGELEITMPNLNYNKKQTKINSKYIDSITYDNNEIKVGDNYTCKIPTSDGVLEVHYKVNTIIPNLKDSKKFSLVESVMNNTTMFVLPLIFKDKVSSSIIQYNKGVSSGYLINAYVDSSFIDKKDDKSIFLLLKFTKSERYKIQEGKFKENKYFVRNIDINYKYVIYEFSIPDEHYKDFLLLINGDYSKISNKSKNKIISFHGSSVEGTIVNSILNRDPNIVKKYEEDLDVDMTGIEIHSPFNESDILTKDIL